MGNFWIPHFDSSSSSSPSSTRPSSPGIAQNTSNGGTHSGTGSAFSSRLDGVSPNGQIFPTPNSRVFTFAELKTATRKFSPDTVLGEEALSSACYEMINSDHRIMKQNHSNSTTNMNTNRPRRRPDLTLPQRDPSLAVPLPLPPPSSAPGSGAQQQTPLPSDLERVRRVGSGSGGTVYMVRHRPTGRIFALKVIYGNHEDPVRRLICREIEILRKANNRYVVQCHGMFDHAGEIQILLEYMERGSLDAGGPMPEPFLTDVARQILHGIAYLHSRKIVHRDIKPSNLLINDRNEVKIAAFGVSRILAQTMDPCNSSVGTIAYMSPERINTDLSNGAYDGYSGDVWSLGVSILECYMGRYPFAVAKQGDWASLAVAICYAQPPEAPPAASKEFRSFIGCCLQKDPAKRWTATQLLQHPFVVAGAGGGNQAHHTSASSPPSLG